MATRSMIGIRAKNGKVTQAIYCHWDGYPSHHMSILTECYTTPKKVRELIALGSISVLAKKAKPIAGIEHSVDGKRQEDVVLAYHRDRGEELCKMIDDMKSSSEASEIARDWGCEYIYLFDLQDNQWKYTEIV